MPSTVARPLVTVVTPSFNQGPFIRATIESVLSQEYPNLQYIIMDGGSTDETESVVKEYGSRLTWISEKDRGQSHAINKGFKMAQGEIVTWLNSDDLFLPGAVARAVKELEAHPQYAAVYGEGYQIDRRGRVLQRFGVTEPFNLWKLVHLSDYILQQTVYFRRSVFDEVGFIDEDLHYVMDWDILIRIGKRYEMGYIPEFMGCLREYPEAKSFSGGAKRVAEIGELMQRHAGKRMTPGYIVYGLDTYRRIWSQRVAASSPRVLKLPAFLMQWTLNRICLQIIGSQIFNSQGWSRDGWAGRRLRLMAPATANAIILRGMNPQSGGIDTLAARSGGAVYARFHLPVGPFSIRIPMPDGQSGPYHLELDACGRLGFLPNSSRCYLLNRIECQSGGKRGQYRETAAPAADIDAVPAI